LFVFYFYWPGKAKPTIMQKHFPFALLLLLLAVAGCYYSPDGEYFEDISSDGTPPFVEVELNFDTDTIYVNSSDWIYFHYTENGDQVNWSRFIIDGEETSPNDDQEGAIELYWYFSDFSPGIHSLSLQLFTRSGTGSIADYSGAEGFLVQKDWVLVIADDYELASDIIDTSYEDGFLKLSWEKYKGVDFEKYEVFKFVQPTALPDQLVATITDQHQTSVIDLNYHGENSIYYVRTNDRYRGSSIQIEGPLPLFSAGNNALGDIVLHWEKPPYWAALQGYRILDDEISWTSAGFVPLYTINSNEVDSFVVPHPVFAYEYDFWLQLDPAGTAYLENHTRPLSLATSATASYGLESPEFSWKQVGSNNKIYLLNNKILHIFDTETLENSTVTNLPAVLRFDVSQNNQYLTGQVWGTDEILFYDLEKSESRTLDISDQISGMSNVISVSNQGTGIVMAGNRVALVDFENEQLLAEKELANNGLYQNEMSGDGNYFMLETYGGYSWYLCKNNAIAELERIKIAESEPQFSDFLEGDETQLVVASNEHVSVYSCATQELLFRWEFAEDVETTVFHVVKGTNQLFISEGGELVLLHLKTGERTELAQTKNTSKWDLVYNNGQILWSKGKRLDVSDKL